MQEELKSYKPYARIVTIISALIIVIAGLDASQVIQLFPDYANQINTILFIAGLLAPAVAQEKRIVRAEELKDQEYKQEDAVEEEELIDDGI